MHVFIEVHTNQPKYVNRLVNKNRLYLSLQY